MSWATEIISRLKDGETVSFRPKGNSMTPKIKSGDLCTVEPIKNNDVIANNDIVLCKVNGNQYLHIVSAVKGDLIQISNNHGRINGWTNHKNIFGKLVKVDK